MANSNPGSFPKARWASSVGNIEAERISYPRRGTGPRPRETEHDKIVGIRRNSRRRDFAVGRSAELDHRRERPAITVPLPVPGIEVERRDRIERREVETTGRGGCDLKDCSQGRSVRIEDCDQRAMRLTSLDRWRRFWRRSASHLGIDARLGAGSYADQGAADWPEGDRANGIDGASIPAAACMSLPRSNPLPCGDVHNNAVLLIAILDEHGTVEVVLVSEFIIISSSGKPPPPPPPSASPSGSLQFLFPTLCRIDRTLRAVRCCCVPSPRYSRARTALHPGASSSSTPPAELWATIFGTGSYLLGEGASRDRGWATLALAVLIGFVFWRC